MRRTRQLGGSQLPCGYRLFVDSMLKTTPLSKKSVTEMANKFTNEADPETLLAHASEVLSELTRFAGMVVFA